MSIEMFLTGKPLPFNLAILMITVVSILWLGWIRLVVGWRQRRVLTALFDGVRPKDYTWQIFKDRYAHLPTYARTTPAGDRARQIWDIRNAEFEIDNDLTSVLSQERLSRRVVLVSYAPTAVVLLGLLGTLYGLSMGVREIQAPLSTIQSVSVMKVAVLKATEGMSTAFVTTFTGVLGALILGSALALYRRWESSILTVLDESISLYLIPACQTSEASTISESARALRRLQENLTSGLEQLLQSFQSKSEEVAQELQQRFDSVAAEIRDESSQVLSAFRTTIERVNAIVGAEENPQISLAQQVRYLSEYAETLDSVLSRHRELNQELKRDIGDLISQQSSQIRTQLDRQMQSLEAFSANISLSVKDLEHNRKEWSEDSREFAEAIRMSLDKGHSALDRLLNELHETETTLTESIQELTGHINTFADQISGQWSQTNEATQSLREHISESGATLRSLVSDSGTALARVGRRLEDQLETFRKLLEQEQATTQEDRERYLSQLHDMSAKIADDLQKHQYDFRDSINSVIQVLKSNLSKFDLETALLPVKETISKLEASAADLVKILKTLDEKRENEIEDRDNRTKAPPRKNFKERLKRLIGRSK